MRSRLSYTKLWTYTGGGWPSTGTINLSENLSSFDGIRLSHSEDYSNSGNYKCTDLICNTIALNQLSWDNPFWEGGWYLRGGTLTIANSGNALSGNFHTQIKLPSSTNGSAWNNAGYLHLGAIYGIKYNDTDIHSAANKVYADRTLLYDNGGIYWHNAVTGKITVPTAFSAFEFIEYEMNNPMANHIAPGTGRFICPTYAYDESNNWYWRSTQWYVGNNFTTLNFGQYLQAPITTTAWSTDSGTTIPTNNKARVITPVKIWGIGRKI